jgi:hypothetical protein
MTKSREGRRFSGPVAADTVIYGGGMVAINADGRAVPASNAANLTVVGVSDDRFDNKGGAAGAINAIWQHGIFKFKNDGTLPVTAAMVGQKCYVQDDETVRAIDAGEGATNPVAGTVCQLDADGVWVEIPE